MGCQGSKVPLPGPVAPTLLPRVSDGSSATLLPSLANGTDKNVPSHVLSSMSYQHALTPVKASDDSPRKMVSMGAATPLIDDSSKSRKTVSFHMGPPEDIIFDSDREVHAAAVFQHEGRHLRAAMLDPEVDGVVVQLPKVSRSVTWWNCQRGGIANAVDRVVEVVEVSQDLTSSPGSSWKLRKPLSPAAQEALERHQASKYNFLSTWTDGFWSSPESGACWQ